MRQILCNRGVMTRVSAKLSEEETAPIVKLLHISLKFLSIRGFKSREGVTTNTVLDRNRNRWDTGCSDAITAGTILQKMFFCSLLFRCQSRRNMIASRHNVFESDCIDASSTHDVISEHKCQPV